MMRLVHLFIGAFFIVLGLAGIVLPVLPGWIFILIGVSYIAPRYAIALKRRLNRKFFKQDSVHIGEWRSDGVIAGFTTKHFPLVLKKTDDLLDLSHQNAFRELLWKSHVFLETEKASLNRFAFLNQVHGSEVVVLEDAKLYDKEGFYHFLKADGIVTDIPRLTLLAMSADCLSIFLMVPDKAQKRKAAWIGIAHAGWRGTAEKIAQKTVARLVERSGCRPEDVHVAFGPCISGPYYEVGEEFKNHFGARSLKARKGKFYFDLAAENRHQLVEAGVKPKNFIDQKICTMTENKDFYSFRKEKENAGRMISFITKL